MCNGYDHKVRSLCVSIQVCDQAAGGLGVLRGGHPQQRAGRPGDHGEQAQQGEAEAHEGAEHPQTGRSSHRLPQLFLSLFSPLQIVK